MMKGCGKFRDWIFISLLFLNYSIFAQESSIFTQKKKSFFKDWSEPKKASVMSAIVPGLGQVYNKKYWKVPIVYGLGGGLAYTALRQHNNYLYYKSELLNVLNGGISKEGYSAQQLSLLKNESKKWRDLSIAGVVAVYILNILDANVDAHLKHFDISDNLTFSVFPSYLWVNNHCAQSLNFNVIMKF